jgi:endonuclease/exonuclease/phosphatase family metal-dependent hydrolase
MGDLNAEATSPEIAYLLGGEGPSGMTFVDCWLEAGDGGAGHTLTPDNPNAALRHSRARRIDYVLLARPATPNADQGKGRPVSSRLVFNQPADGVWPSDHFGVLADIAPY